MMVISVSNSTKDLFVTWHVPHTTNICVAKEDGGAGLDAYVSNGGYAPPEYIIKPDRSFVSDKDVEINDAYIQSLGIRIHSCDTHSEHFTMIDVTEAKPLVCEINDNSFTLNVFNEDMYSVKFFSANGKRSTVLPSQSLNTGLNVISFGENIIAKGVYFAEIKNGKHVNRQKLVIK